MFKNLKDLNLMKTTIRTRSILSAPGKDGLTNPRIKLERNVTAKMFVELMKPLIISECPTEWKGARTKLIHKGRNTDDSGNWHPITINSILYRIIFCRISQSLYQVDGRAEKIECYPEQKGFAPK